MTLLHFYMLSDVGICSRFTGSVLDTLASCYSLDFYERICDIADSLFF